MTEANNIDTQHRPLMAGIAVMPHTGGGERGTLSGIARRNSDNKKVLATNPP